MTLFDTTGFRVLQEGINICAKNRDVIANNIINQDTPGYKCKYLQFGAVLRDKMNMVEGEKYTKELHFADYTITDRGTEDQPDENNVDFDTQQNLFVQNSVLYDALVNQMNSEFTLMRSAMRRT
ncbi:MAG: flagellar basal body rod protein FlgB [Ruminiclostridium sp.]|nr:flagellar basal body rod protein FlgB [Ruminiclostridium sp.]MDE6725859.1 flagellar basal body rod protein FlgB [Ruminiclostridium sp.]